MNVYLLRSKELNEKSYRDVLNLLQSFPGYINFMQSEIEDIQATYEMKTFDDEDSFSTIEFDIPEASIDFDKEPPKYEFPLKRRSATWNQLFNQCRVFRRSNDIGDTEAVILLTDVSNTRNWFSGAQEDHFNFFIHTKDWEFFLGNSVDRRYPIAYQVAANLLRYFMFDNYGQVMEYVHTEPRGCIMDFCESKREVILKLRTGDVCNDCLQIINERNIDRRLVKQCFDIIDGVRDAMMFRSRSQILNQPSRMELRGHLKKIFLTDLGDLEVRLNPKERSLYLLFLDHPEGINLNELSEHREELLRYYGLFSNSDDQETIVESVERLVNPLDDNLNTVISRIKRKFREAIGDQLFDHYIISGQRGEAKTISIERSLVQFSS